MLNGNYFAVAVIAALASLSVVGNAGNSRQTNAAVNVDAEVRGVSVLFLDGTDPDNALSLNEMISFGDVDSIGTPISRAPAGSPDVLGVIGIPVERSGKPASSPDDPKCVGAFYSLFESTGKNNKRQHSDAALTIFLAASDRWQLWAGASLVGSSANVTVDQLKWKPDHKTANGFRGYTDFGVTEQMLESGNKAWDFFYFDIGLLVEHEDGPGSNTWMITISFVSD